MKKISSLLVAVLLLLGSMSCDTKRPQTISEPTFENEKVADGENFRSVDPKEIPGNPIQLIGQEWMLISAGSQENYNTMTASWGTIGELWGKPITTCYIRPSRHTFGFVEENQYYTLCFFKEEYRGALEYCGTKSGRDHVDKNKAEVAGLTPQVTENGTVYFKEAYLVLECKKLYSDSFDKSLFTADVVVGGGEKYIDTDDIHKFYIGEIVNCWMR